MKNAFDDAKLWALFNIKRYDKTKVCGATYLFEGEKS